MRRLGVINAKSQFPNPKSASISPDSKDPSHVEKDPPATTKAKTPLSTMETAMSKEHLPKTDSIQELARFWDTHDVSDFDDELEEVKEPVFDGARAITLRLQTDEAETVHKLATSKGVADAELIHQWVREKIHAN